MANERRERYGLPPGLIEELIFSLKTLLGTPWLESLLLENAEPVDPFELKGHPLRGWLKGPNIDKHVMQTLEVARYLKEFSATPSLQGKIRKLRRDLFWPVLFELAIAYRMKQAVGQHGTVALSCETTESLGDFTVVLGSKTIVCECSRLGFPPDSEEPLRLLDSIYRYSADGVKRSQLKSCIKIRLGEPLTGQVYNRLLVRLKEAIKDFQKAGQLATRSNKSFSVTVEALTALTEKIPFQLLNNRVVDVAGTDWTSAVSISSVEANSEREVADKVRHGEPITGGEHTRIFVRLANGTGEPDAYRRLSQRIRKKISQTKLRKEVSGRIIFVEWPVDFRQADIVRLRQQVLERLRGSHHTIAVVICRREANPHYRHHYSLYAVVNTPALDANPELVPVLGRFTTYDTDFDPILNEKYQHSWREATEKVTCERRLAEEKRHPKSNTQT